MTLPRHGHTSTGLHDNTVLIVGGYTSSSGPRKPASLTPTAEILVPFALIDGWWYESIGMSGLTEDFQAVRNEDGSFAALPGLRTGLAEHTATLLRDGSVLIAGGLDFDPDTLASVPVAKCFVYVPIDPYGLYYIGK